MSWDHKGIRIEVNQHGQFQFDTGNGATCYAKSLKDAQEEVEKYLKLGKPKDLKLQGWVVKETINNIGVKNTFSVVQVTLLGVNGTTGEVRMTPPLTADNIEVGIFPGIDGMQQRLEAYVKAKAELDAITESLIPYQIPLRYGYGRITAAAMPDMLDKLAADYGVARIGKSAGRGRG